MSLESNYQFESIPVDPAHTSSKKTIVARATNLLAEDDLGFLMMSTL
jgi:hypothetical protein